MEQQAKRSAYESRDGTAEPPAREQIPDKSPSIQSSVSIEEIDEDGLTVQQLEQQIIDDEDDFGRDQDIEDVQTGEQSDTEDYFESILDEMEELLNTDRDGTEFVVTVDPELKKEIGKDLQTGGPVLFMRKYLLCSERPVPLVQILCALGFPLLMDKAETHPNDRLELMVQIAMKHFLSQRPRLPYPRTIDDFVQCIKDSNKIIVLSGAGISTSLGIPDFRSDDGLYAQLKGLGLADPQDVFDIKLFKQDPTIFYSVAKKILPAEKKFTPTHQFIKLLQDNGKLLRNYTQNIDNLEVEAGVDPDKLVQCHGSFGIAYCFSCFRKVDGTSLYPDILQGKVPRCEPCTAKAKKLEAEEHELPDSFGVFKPEITFFGESLPDRFDELLFKGGDAENCDLLICIGTSLKVAPVSGIVKIVGRDVPQVYISKTPCKQYTFDVSVLGPCDDVVELICQKLGWKMDHEMAKRAKNSDDTIYPDGTIQDDGDGVYTFVETPTEPVDEITGST